MRSVFDLHPVGRTARPVRPIAALRYQALEPHVAGRPEKIGSNFALLKGGNEYAVGPSREQPREVGFPHAEGQRPQIVTVERQHVEGVQLHLIIMPPRMQRIEVGDAIDAEHHRFAVDDELAAAVLERGLNDPRIAAAPIIAVARNQPDAVAIAL